MTAAELLRDMRSAHAARTSYRRFADALWQQASDMYADGWFGWAKQIWQFALIAENAAWAEDRNPDEE